MDKIFCSGIQPIEETEQYLALVLERVRQWNEAAPRLQELRDQLNWQKEVLINCPAEARPLMQSGITSMASIASQNQQYIKTAIPMIPPIDSKTLVNSMAISTSGVNIAYGQLTIVAQLGTPLAMNYAQVYTSKYQELQHAQERSQAVRALIEKLSPSTLERFDKALAAFNMTKVQIGSESAAAAEIRTLLDGVKGELFSRAKSNPKENMTWNDMAQRLGKCDPEKVIITGEEAKRSSLYSQLSDVLKDRGRTSQTLADLWTQVLDHLFTVLGLTT